MKFVRYWSINLPVTIRNGSAPEISEETSMGPSPTKVELRKVVACKKIDKLEKVVSLSKDHKLSLIHI